MKTITRGQAIDLLRQKCLALVDDEHSLCEVASRLHILCGGFGQWELGELRRRYDWIVKKNPGLTRRRLEDLANRWQLARQFALERDLSCDVQARERLHPICRGWEGHSDEDLARFCRELTGEDCCVRSEAAEPQPDAGA